MDPITLLVFAAIGAVAAAATVITWQAVENWLAAKRVYGGTARIIQERLQNGKYQVVAGVFDTRGTLTAQQVWKGGSLDNELTSQFQRNGGVIVVNY